MTIIYFLLRIHVPYKTDIRYSLPIKAANSVSYILFITTFFSVKTRNFAIIQQEISFFRSIWRREHTNGKSFSKHKSLYAAVKLRLKAYVKRNLRSAT